MSKLSEMKSELASLKRQEVDLDLICTNAEKEAKIAYDNVSNKLAERLRLENTIETIEEEVSSVTQNFQEHLGTMFVAHCAGELTDGNFQTIYTNCGLEMPDKLGEELPPDEEATEENTMPEAASG